MQDDYAATAAFLKLALQDIAGFDSPDQTKVMDFGCGEGRLVRALLQYGFDAHGCDVLSAPAESERLRSISRSPYKLPFPDATFDAVVSTSVLEHAQNTEECFREIHRVLKPGGYAMHLYPGKWYLPSEPHIYVPLVNYFWPARPKWWLGLWAFFGVRNEYQQGLGWRTVLASNHEYCRSGLCYISNSSYRALSLTVFGNYRWPMEFYIDQSPGGFAALFRKLPFKRISGWLARNCRMAFLVQHKPS